MERDQLATQERHVTLARPEVGSLDEALAWVVQTVDTAFVGATMVKITVEQIGRSFGGEDEWSYPWTAAVSGHYEEPVNPDRIGGAT